MSPHSLIRKSKPDTCVSNESNSQLGYGLHVFALVLSTSCRPIHANDYGTCLTKVQWKSIYRGSPQGKTSDKEVGHRGQGEEGRPAQRSVWGQNLGGGNWSLGAWDEG